MEDTVTALAQWIPGHRMIAAKELTKMFEKHFVGTVAEVANQVRAEIAEVGKKGEWCFAIAIDPENKTASRERSAEGKDVGSDSVEKGAEPRASEEMDEQAWTKALQCLKNAGVSVSESARQVSQVYGVQKRQAYDVALRIAGVKE